MNQFQAQTIINDQIYVDAVLDYRSDPIGVTDKTFRRAELWIQADHILNNDAVRKTSFHSTIIKEINDQANN
tara:strand:- start:172 stop:387 length:216 start_codon:yes stop_codon:yes gene_type:complete